ncbi:deoxyribonuclease IV [Halobacteriales archaeon Cl-PHB]
MRLGAHASVAGGVHNAVAEQRDYGGNCGQLFSHSPQVWDDPAVDPDNAEQFREQSAEHDLEPWVLHSSYLVNLATPKANLREQSIESLQGELDVASELDVAFVNVHLGAHTGAGVEAGLANAASAIDALDVPEDVTLLVESDAGSGTKLGGEFEHLAAVLEATDQVLGVTLDTAHAFAAGYDLSSPAAVQESLATFDGVVGFEHLACVHLNDSKHPCGSHKDEHAHVGKGEIGEAGMRAFVNHDAIRGVPLVLETPTENGKSFPWNVRRVRELRDESR